MMDNLPVVIRKDRKQLGSLAKPGCTQRILCPHGILLAILDAEQVLKIHVFCNTDAQCTIDSDRYKSFMWIIKSSHDNISLTNATTEYSYLLAVTHSNDLKIFEIGHKPFLYDKSEDETTENNMALLPFKMVSSMSHRQITNILSKAQLGTSIQSLYPLGTSDGGIIALLANDCSVLRLSIHHSSCQLLLLAVFTIDPNMSVFDDGFLPQYVGKITCIKMVWPLIFTLTDDGIILVYNLTSTKCICAINPIEYCRLCHPQQQDSVEILSHVSSSTFLNLTVSPDLMKLAIFTSTHHTLVVNLPNYFKHFPNHYPKVVHSKIPHQSSLSKVSVQASKAAVEEEDDMLRYGGVSRRQRFHGAMYHGPFVGHYATQKNRMILKEKVKNVNLQIGQGLNLDGTISMKDSSMTSLTNNSTALLKWYEQSPANERREDIYDSDRRRSNINYDGFFTSSFGRRGSTTPSNYSTSRTQSRTHSRKPSYNIQSNSNWSSYPFNCILPSPDTPTTTSVVESLTVDSSRFNRCSLFYMDCSNTRLIGYYCDDDCLQTDSVIVSGLGLEQSVTYITVYNLIEQNYLVVKLPRPNWVILSTRLDKPVYLVSEKFLSLAAFTLAQEDFVAKVLMYGSASVAEEVCHLNRWDQCSLPLNALETALELRQLDTVSFFLRNRDSLSQQSDQGRSKSGKSSSNQPPPPLPPDQLDAAVELLTNSIKHNHDSEHNRQFAGQLLGMTLNFLLRLTKTQSHTMLQSHSDNLTSDQDSVTNRDVTDSLEGSSLIHRLHALPNINVTTFIQNLRHYIPKIAVHGQSGQGTDTTDINEEGFEHLLTKVAMKESWENKSFKDVIRQSLIRGNLPLAHAYLINKSINSGRGDHTFGDDTNVTLSGIISVGLGFVMEELSLQNLEQAISILGQMGANVKESLRFIFLHTVQRQLRDFLANKLKSCNWLTDSELNGLDYIHVLESYYPLEEYRAAETIYSRSSPLVKRSTTSSIHGDSLSTWMDEKSGSGLTLSGSGLSVIGNITDHYPEYFGGDQAVVMEPVSCDDHSDVFVYLQIPMYVVLEWDSVARQRILYEGMIMSGKSKDSSKHLNQSHQKAVYHICHHDSIAIQETSLEDTITVDMILTLYNKNQCGMYIKNLFLDKLAREGQYGAVNEKNLDSLLCRLGRVHTLFTNPHPLSHSDQLLIPVEQFHCLFIKYLIEKKFNGLLYLYLDYYKLATGHKSIKLLGLSTPDLPPWVEYLVQCRLAARNPKEPSRVFSTSLSCSRLLRGTNTVTDGIRNGHLLMTLATMMYAPLPVSECISVININKPWYVDLNELKQILVAFPTLQAAIFPSKSKRLTPAESQDMSVYQLLKSGIPFDVSKLFKWQKTNTIAAADDNIEEPQELPHFSQPHLSQKYAMTVNLTYRYFLQQGQPSFALANFVASKLANCSNPNKRIDKVVSRVYKLIMADFANNKLVSSCMAFIEMLSRDSTHMRIDSLAANRIYMYKINRESKDKADESNANRDRNILKIGSQFIQLYQTPDKALSKVLLKQLERATCYYIKSIGMESCSIDAEISWNHVQQFCLCHALPPSLVFLRECASHGQWLPLLCHAQLYKVPAKEVLRVVDKDFSNSITKEHLQLAISTMDMIKSPVMDDHTSRDITGRSKGRSRRRHTGKANSSPGEPRPVKRELSQRDRAKFYSKFGVSAPSIREDTPTSSPKLGTESINTPSLDVSIMSAHNEQAPHNHPIAAHNVPDDFFSVLFHCQDHPSPWQALLAYCIALERPLLALLAGCYPDSSPVDCMCVWLCSTIGCSNIEKVALLLNLSKSSDDELRYDAGLQWKRWSVNDLGYLLLAAMLATPTQASQLPLLFQYFDKSNPLYYFMKFHEEFTVRFDMVECEKMLKEFALQLDKCNRLGSCYHGLVGDIMWVEDIVVTYAGHMIVTCPTPFERSQLLKLLVECNFGDGFSCKQISDFHQLHEISYILEKANLSSVPAFKITGDYNPTTSSSQTPSLLELYNIRTRIDNDLVLGVLIEKGQFMAAREYAKVAQVSIAQVTIKEVEFQYQKLADSSYWQYQPARFDFWQKCHTSFIVDNVKPEAAAEFFESVQNSVHLSHNERTLLLVMSLNWRKQGKLYSPGEERETEKQIWLSHISTLADETTTKIPQQSLDELITDPSLSPAFHRHPNQGKPPLPILSELCVTDTPKVTETFTLHQLVLPADTIPMRLHKDGKPQLNKKESAVLDIVIGRLLNIGWINQARKLAALFEHDSTDLTIVLCCIQLASNKLSPDHLTQDILDLLASQPPKRLATKLYMPEEGGVKANVSMEIIRMLQQLSERAKHVHNCCYCIITCYRIANTLHRSFSSIVTGDTFDILAEVLSSRYSDKFSLAGSFVKSVNIQPKQVAGFLSNCIASSLQSTSEDMESDYSRIKVYERNMTTSQFMSLCSLCTDHALLGQHLLSMSKSLSGSDNPTGDSLMVQVELLIRSHDCYTLDCSVDGIAEILRVSREITNLLYNGKHYKLMVRLLTGVGRFREMAYIIHFLLECDEFESLVHPKVDKVEQLKVALMEYLCKHSRDSEKLEMVALKFEMYRELARTREEKGQRELLKLKHKQLTSENDKTLKQIYADFRDAAEIYAKDSCMANSEHCLSQARLIALQLSVLGNGKQVLNLDSRMVQKFMEEQPFIEALIVANAYKRTTLAEWVNPIYHQVIIKGHMTYLHEFTSVFPLNNSMMQDLASKYMLERTRSSDMSSNMKKILGYCNSLTLKHKISSQLGLQETYSDTLVNDGFLSDVTKL